MPAFVLRDSDRPSEVRFPPSRRCMHARRTSYDAQAPPDLTEVRIFIAFQAIGAIGILAVLLTVILAPKVYRHFTWLNFCITWLIYCISYLLL